AGRRGPRGRGRAAPVARARAGRPGGERRAARGRLLFVDGLLDIRGTLDFTGLVVAAGGVRVAGAGRLAIAGALWVDAPGVGGPLLDVAGSLALRQQRAAMATADGLLPLPRRPVLLGVRDLG